ncbi:uncharacterized protein [Epargyreus clarus]|uniref:uncharacterized protein n=1 Tax=Epargyreus clarus TaxID=520877 RepID=UPI003C30A8B2
MIGVNRPASSGRKKTFAALAVMWQLGAILLVTTTVLEQALHYYVCPPPDCCIRVRADIGKTQNVEEMKEIFNHDADPIGMDSLNIADPTQKELRKYANPTQKELREYADPTQKELREYADPTQKELREYADPTQKELREYADPTQKELRKYAGRTQKELREYAEVTQKERYTLLADPTQKTEPCETNYADMATCVTPLVEQHAHVIMKVEREVALNPDAFYDASDAFIMFVKKNHEDVVREFAKAMVEVKDIKEEGRTLHTECGDYKKVFMAGRWTYVAQT